MVTRRVPQRIDDQPARWAMGLWRQWVDPVGVAFDELAAVEELDALRSRMHGASQTSNLPGANEGAMPD